MARIPEVVVDASVVCKWLVPETGSEAALGLRDAHASGRVRVLAPQLLGYELTNVLRYHPKLSPEDLRAAIRFFFDLQPSMVEPSPTMLALAIDFATRKRLTVYDACYAILADDRDCPLITDDRRMRRACSRAVLIAEWTPS